jgi:hypothetical protein
VFVKFQRSPWLAWVAGAPADQAGNGHGSREAAEVLDQHELESPQVAIRGDSPARLAFEEVPRYKGLPVSYWRSAIIRWQKRGNLASILLTFAGICKATRSRTSQEA